MNKLRLWPVVQLILMLTLWIVTYKFGHKMEGTPSGFTWQVAGLVCIADPVDGNHPGAKQCDPWQFTKIFGKIFINGGLQSDGLGMEFGYWIIYDKYVWLMAQYLFFFHYGAHIMRCVRAVHRWIPTNPAAHLPPVQRALTMAASVCVRLGVLVLFDFTWKWTEPTSGNYFMHEVLPWPGVQLLLQPVGAIIWMLCLYKCGVTFKLAGETILGYFLVGYFIPPSLYAHSIVGKEWLAKAQGCDFAEGSAMHVPESCDNEVLGYLIQMFLTNGFVLGWIQIQSPFVQTLAISQFKGLAAAYKALSACLRKDATLSVQKPMNEV